jgi:hypothetical protein
LDGSSFGVLILTVSGVVNPSADQGQSLHFVTVREGLISPIIFWYSLFKAEYPMKNKTNSK